MFGKYEKHSVVRNFMDPVSRHRPFEKRLSEKPADFENWVGDYCAILGHHQPETLMKAAALAVQATTNRAFPTIPEVQKHCESVVGVAIDKGTMKFENKWSDENRTPDEDKPGRHFEAARLMQSEFGEEALRRGVHMGLYDLFRYNPQLIPTEATFRELEEQKATHEEQRKTVTDPRNWTAADLQAACLAALEGMDAGAEKVAQVIRGELKAGVFAYGRNYRANQA